MSWTETDTSWVPAADLAEQQTPRKPGTEDAISFEDATSLPDAVALDGADEADVLEQSSPAPLDDDDYPWADSVDQPA
jgi:hypothetical protein